MKVLWFTNGPSLYIEKLKGKTVLGGWIPSLEKMFHERDIELGLAFHADVEKLTPDSYNSKQYYLIPGLNRKDKFVRLKNRWLNTIIDPEEALINYKKVIDDYQPDIVQIWGSEQPYGLVIPYLNVPHILHIQGVLTAYYQKYFSGITRPELLKARSLNYWFKREPVFFSDKKFLKEVKIEKEIFRLCRNFFGRTDWDRRISTIMSPGSNYFHCDEIIRDDFSKIEWQPKYKGGQFKILSVFRDSIYKGFESVFDSAHFLTEMGISFNWDIVGVDRNNILKDVLRKNRSYNPEALPIRLRGYLNADELLKIYGESDLFVHPSHIDNSPNSVCEAMLLGIPIISTNAGGVPSLIKNNESGTLVQDGDNIALAGAVFESIESYNRSCQMAVNAKQEAFKRHDKEKIFETVINTYNKLLN